MTVSEASCGKQNPSSKTDFQTVMNNHIFIGWDRREDVAYQVARYSINKRNSNIQVSPLKLDILRDSKLYWREIDKLASTEFTFTRFLVPYLNGYKGWSIFVDCDFLFLDDPQKLFDLADDRYAVQVVQHDYTPTEATKMDGQQQHLYPRKNWSSMILFNCAHPKNKALNLENINTQTGAWLHQFKWLDDEEIGKIHHEWNWLAGWYHEPGDGKPKAIHFTEGGPWFENHQDVEYAALWNQHRHEFVQTGLSIAKPGLPVVS
jgi:lipopolysaccharide biosynthesis glycosyltransferase